jgi:DNA polymerase I
LNSEEDVHTQFGVTVLNWNPEKIRHDKRVRRVVKELHFGLIYGLRPKGLLARCLQRGAETDLNTVTAAHSRYFAVYTGVRDFIEGCIEYVEQHHRTYPSLFGRSRPMVPDDSGEGEKGYWKNSAVNTPVQTSASDFLLLAMSIVNSNRERYRLVWDLARMEIHDSLVLTPKLKDLEETDGIVQRLVEHDTLREAEKLFKLKMLVPWSSEASAGFRFGVMVEYDRMKMGVGDFLRAWSIKNKKIEDELLKSPLRHIDARSGR